MKTDEQSKLTILLPKRMHLRFKAACALAEQDMSEELRHFIERRTAELEKEAKGK